MCSGERQVRHINYQAYLHTEILFWTLKKPKINQTLPKIAIKKYPGNSRFLLYIWAGSNLISKQVCENLMIPLKTQGNLD